MQPSERNHIHDTAVPCKAGEGKSAGVVQAVQHVLLQKIDRRAEHPADDSGQERDQYIRDRVDIRTTSRAICPTGLIKNDTPLDGGRWRGDNVLCALIDEKWRGRVRVEVDGVSEDCDR